MALLDRLRRLEAKYANGGQSPLIVLASSDHDWRESEQRYTDEQGIQVELLTPGHPAAHLATQARDLAQLRALTANSRVGLIVLPGVDEGEWEDMPIISDTPTNPQHNKPIGP